MEVSRKTRIFVPSNIDWTMKKKDSRNRLEENTSCLMAGEPALATADVEVSVMPDDLDYAQIIDGVLQITPDIEEEIAEVEQGQVVSMDEFNTMFAKWLD